MDINNVQNDITEFTYKISQAVKETEEEFIFQTIQPYCEQILERKISKKELTELLTQGYTKGYNEGKKFTIQEDIDLAHELCDECYGDECGGCRIVDMIYMLEEKLEKME